jgi:translation elongation factor EF-Ts
MEKRTRVQYCDMLLAIEEVANNEELKAFVEKTKEQFIKKNSNKGNSKMIAINEEITNLIISELKRLGGNLTITDLMNSSEAITNYTYVDGKETKRLTNSKITAMLSPLVRSEENTDGVIKRETIKKKSYYSAI